MHVESQNTITRLIRESPRAKTLNISDVWMISTIQSRGRLNGKYYIIHGDNPDMDNFTLTERQIKNHKNAECVELILDHIAYKQLGI